MISLVDESLVVIDSKNNIRSECGEVPYLFGARMLGPYSTALALCWRLPSWLLCVCPLSFPNKYPVTVCTCVILVNVCVFSCVYVCVCVCVCVCV